MPSPQHAANHNNGNVKFLSKGAVLDAFAGQVLVVILKNRQ
jgi:hypothetical protein